MWEDLVSSALVGTQRQKWETNPTSSSDSLNSMLSQLTSQDVELNLLNAASLVSLYNATGKIPDKHEEPLLEPCPFDETSICSPSITRKVPSLLEGKNKVLLPEFLDLLIKSGQRLSDESLCAILNHGSHVIDLREKISKVIGKRGRWLAEQNSEWSYAKIPVITDETPEQIWQLGNKSARINLLKELRTKDPQKARELVISTWKEETADYRYASISTFKVNLSIEDEPFLEKALDDRARDIRLEAQTLLSQLPNSQFHLRMLKQLSSIVTIKVEKKKTVIEVNLPGTLDQATTRDIVDVNPPDKSIGQKAWWLRSIAKSVTPEFWTDLLKLSPKEIIPIINKSDWSEDLLYYGISIASANHSKVEWARALFEIYFDNLAFIADYNKVIALFTKLPPADKEDLIATFISKEQKKSNPNLVLQLAYTHKTTWSPKLVRLVLNAAVEQINNKKIDWNFSSLLEHMVIHIPLNMFDEIFVLFDENNFEAEKWKNWEKIIDNFISLLKFRQKLLKEFNQ